MKTSIIAVGTELLFGQTVNTNASYLSENLNLMGFDVMYHFVVGDNPDRLREKLAEAFTDTDLGILTGGLGPTQDDLTKEIVAEYMGADLYRDEKVVEDLKAFFEKRGRHMAENNLKQAYLPVGCTPLYNASGTAPGFALEKDIGRYKLFTSDVGLFVTLAFKDKNYTENIIYNKLLSDKLDANLGYVYENAVAQMLKVKGNNLFYYTMESETSNHLYEIDFLISVGDKLCPIEVKSGNYRTHRSLDVFCDKFSRRIKDKYVVHIKDFKRENGINYIPVYMLPFL